MGGVLKDYSEAFMIIKELRKEGQDAAVEQNWSLVCDIADAIIETALRLKIYSVVQMEKE